MLELKICGWKQKIGAGRALFYKHKLQKMSAVNPSASTSAKKVVKRTASPSPSPAATTVPVAAVPAAPATPAKVVKRVASPSPAPVAAVETAAAVEGASETTLADEIRVLTEQLTAIRDSATAALTSLKRVSKRATTEIKTASKGKRRARAERAEGEERKPSNFEIPVPISDELSAFLGGGKNNQMSRAQVNSAMSKYYNENNLRTKHTIKANPALRKLLGIGSDVELTIFNIQKYLTHHYPQSAAAKAAAAAVVPKA